MEINSWENLKYKNPKRFLVTYEYFEVSKKLVGTRGLREYIQNRTIKSTTYSSNEYTNV